MCVDKKCIISNINVRSFGVLSNFTRVSLILTLGWMSTLFMSAWTVWLLIFREKQPNPSLRGSRYDLVDEEGDCLGHHGGAAHINRYVISILYHRSLRDTCFDIPQPWGLSSEVDLGLSAMKVAERATFWRTAGEMSFWGPGVYLMTPCQRLLISLSGGVPFKLQVFHVEATWNVLISLFNAETVEWFFLNPCWNLWSVRCSCRVGRRSLSRILNCRAKQWHGSVWCSFFCGFGGLEQQDDNRLFPYRWNLACWCW